MDLHQNFMRTNIPCDSCGKTLMIHELRELLSNVIGYFDLKTVGFHAFP
jgi:hypothetical protein